MQFPSPCCVSRRRFLLLAIAGALSRLFFFVPCAPSHDAAGARDGKVFAKLRYSGRLIEEVLEITRGEQSGYAEVLESACSARRGGGGGGGGVIGAGEEDPGEARTPCCYAGSPEGQLIMVK